MRYVRYVVGSLFRCPLLGSCVRLHACIISRARVQLDTGCKAYRCGHVPHALLYVCALRIYS